MNNSRTVVITGASSGIGRATAIAAAAEGAELVPLTVAPDAEDPDGATEAMSPPTAAEESRIVTIAARPAGSPFVRIQRAMGLSTVQIIRAKSTGRMPCQKLPRT